MPIARTTSLAPPNFLEIASNIVLHALDISIFEEFWITGVVPQFTVIKNISSCSARIFIIHALFAAIHLAPYFIGDSYSRTVVGISQQITY